MKKLNTDNPLQMDTKYANILDKWIKNWSTEIKSLILMPLERVPEYMINSYGLHNQIYQTFINICRNKHFEMNKL